MANRNLMLPGNPRYQPKDLQPIFGYDNLYGPVGEVEVATLQTLAGIGVIPAADFALLTPEAIQQVLAIQTTQVDELERRVTKHDVRAWVRLAQERLAPRLARWVHVPLTSYDVLDTARALQFSRAHQTVLQPKIKRVLQLLVDLIRYNAHQVQIGRTHGQHALPVTVGFWLATIASRILYNAHELDRCAGLLVGKVSGAVGAHNAPEGLQIERRCGGTPFEARVLRRLGLQPAPISTQILPPEPLAYFLHALAMLSAALGQLGRDCRHLMRSEIAEVAEDYEAGQVGSSTMAQKRNPVNFEGLEGQWLRTKHEFGKVHEALISEHQRDLVGSCVARDFPIIVVNVTVQLDTLLRADQQGRPFLLRLRVNPDALVRNFKAGAQFVLAEPLYLALQMAGYEGDAHELVNRRAMPLAQGRGVSLLDAVEGLARDDASVRAALEAIPTDQLELLRSPAHYCGDAQAKALQIAELAEAYARS